MKLAAGEPSTITRIGVRPVRGIVYLAGIVETAAMKDRMGEIVQQVRGVAGTINNLAVQSG